MRVDSATRAASMARSAATTACCDSTSARLVSTAPCEMKFGAKSPGRVKLALRVGQRGQILLQLRLPLPRLTGRCANQA